MSEDNERKRLMKRLNGFYMRRCPVKADDVSFLEKVVNRLIEHPETEDSLFEKLLKKYPKDVVKIKRKKKKKNKRKNEEISSDDDNVPDILRPRERKKDERGKEEKTSEKEEEEEIGVHKKLSNGVEYVNTTKGSGDEKASRGDLITVKYKGSLDGGQEHIFDKGTITFTIGRSEVVKGFDVGVIGMRPGVTRKIFIPSRLGYGSRGAPPVIPSNADLFFEIKLIRIGSRRSMRRHEEKQKRLYAYKTKKLSEDNKNKRHRRKKT